MSEAGLETVEGRLATFYAPHDVSKARPSGAKGAKPSEWPHKSPSPEELAHAGFYFQPTSLSPDNAACFLCERALDGWEEEDDPITEHLRHSSECGWAISVDIARRSSNPDEIEDPTSQRVVDARRATFGSLWPHDGKRGWVCKTEKMVDAGWYYCPIDGSDDFVSCAYCKLSLDGWEPKDDPFDEHYRRSSDCSFFLFASKKTGKSTRGRKARSSRASRLSTQSTVTTASEAPTVDLDDEIDNTMLSQSTTKTSKKKGPKPKGRNTKSKKTDPVEVSSQADMESNDEIVEAPRPKRATRGRKRTNSIMQEHEESGKRSETVTEEPPAKRRATGASDVNMQPEVETTDPMDMVLSDEPLTSIKQPRGRPSKQKRSSSRTKNPYTSSTASKASLRSGAPRDSEIEMQLEAELDTDDITVTEGQMDDEAGSNGLSQNPNSTASVAPVRAAKPELYDDVPDEAESDTAPPPKGKKSTKAKKKVTTKKSSRVHTDQDPGKSTAGSQAGRRGRPKGAKTSVLSSAEDVLEDPDIHDFDAIVAVPQEQPADTEVTEAPVAKKGKGKAVPIKSKKAQSPEYVEPEPIGGNTAPSMASDCGSPKPARIDATSENELFRDGSGTGEPVEPPPEPRNVPHVDDGNNGKRQLSDATRRAPAQPSPHPTSPPAPTQKFTPSPSPQSSDAENHPPSSLPSTARPVLSPSKSQAIKVPLAASTPTTSPSKRLRPGQLTTAHPWIPADLDDVFLANSPNKENINLNDIFQAVKGELTSPEKKLTVEEWIRLNAKNGEDKLRNECERLVGVFEREGGRAMRALEGIECTE